MMNKKESKKDWGKNWQEMKNIREGWRKKRWAKKRKKKEKKQEKRNTTLQFFPFWLWTVLYCWGKIFTTLPGLYFLFVLRINIVTVESWFSSQAFCEHVYWLEHSWALDSPYTQQLLKKMCVYLIFIYKICVIGSLCCTAEIDTKLYIQLNSNLKNE